MSLQPASTERKDAHIRQSLVDLPKSWLFTSSLPPDPEFPTPAASHKIPRAEIEPRQVRGALFSWVRPDEAKDPELLAVSPASLTDLGILEGDEKSTEFKQIVAGNLLVGWDAEKKQGGYPWAQCYGGWQFGVWAGQLGDGRAISLFEITNQNTNVRYELQLKGAGITPYSRFADGRAVLRSSVREFVCSEALNALGIPTTRALSLTLLPSLKVRRETLEPGAIVARFAQSWLRIGTFDILRARGERKLIRKLCTYLAENVFDGWESLPARIKTEDDNFLGPISTGIPKDTIEGPSGLEENRFTRLYREIVRRNAKTVAAWQAYGFVNGVLNTDNTSLYGLSIDFGPFAFLDNFDPHYTPNHDDHMLRYAYRNQPTVILWNLVRLGESFGELLGAGPDVDDAKVVAGDFSQESISNRAEALIVRTCKEYKAVFHAEYTKIMSSRLGLKTSPESDFKSLYSELLDTMEEFELDFNHFFRRLSSLRIDELEIDAQRRSAAKMFFPGETTTDSTGHERIENWLDKWRHRVIEDWGPTGCDSSRQASMLKVNPKFLARNWVLEEVITRVTSGDRTVLDRVMAMACAPFAEAWGGDKLEEERWCGDVPKHKRAMQCSCSS
ncbi:Protein adenylyltransferase [Podosphaera aphanis]|nr:Protein adenylyltransferase [Podosphaera aphanis]